MRGAIKVACLAVAALSWLGGNAHAGPLFGNAFGMPAYTGSHLLFGASGGFTANVTGDFSVFAPGPAFQNFLNATDPNNLDLDPLNNHLDPSGGTRFVYAYQLLNVFATTTPFVNFTVGIDTGDPVLNVGSFASYGGKNPTSTSLPGTSVRWNWAGSGNTIGNGSSSSLLFFTSIRAPELDDSQGLAGISAKSASQQGGISDTPSPGPVVPEPGTLVLASVGFALLTFSRFARRRTLVR